MEAEVQSLRERGNACVKEQKYPEAMFHYTHAIKLDPQNYSLYSNRSYAFLKMQQYHSAMEDALMTIKLNPSWTKGYFRKAEVESQTFRFSDALQSYNQALALHPNDTIILEAMNKVSRSMIQDKRADQQISWLGAGVGIILGVTIVIADYVFPNKPSLTHPLVMALLTICTAMLGFGVAKGFRYFVKCQRQSLLDPPIDLLGESEKLNENMAEANNEKEKQRERDEREREERKREEREREERERQEGDREEREEGEREETAYSIPQEPQIFKRKSMKREPFEYDDKF